MNSMNASDTNTSGQSGSIGSAMTKLCWMRSRVVAISKPTRDGGGGGTALPAAGPALASFWERGPGRTPHQQRAALHAEAAAGAVARARTSMTSPTAPAVCDRSRESYFTSSGSPAPASAALAVVLRLAVRRDALLRPDGARDRFHAPSAYAATEPSVLRVTSTCTPMNFTTSPPASFTGAARCGARRQG